MSAVDDLHKLAELKERGIITAKEFEKKKAQILSGSTNATAPKKRMGFVAKLAIAVGAVVVLGKLSQENTGSVTSPTAGTSKGTIAPATLTSSLPPTPTAEDRVKQGMARDQSQLVAAVDAARRQYAAGGNDMAKGAARPARARAICSAIQARSVSNWIGKVASLSTNGDGKGVMSVEIGPDIFVKTWNNSLSDIGDRTLIDPSSSLFTIATNFREGQVIRFGGNFFNSDADCLKEASMSLSGSISSPEFIFAFRSLAAAN